MKKQIRAVQAVCLLLFCSILPGFGFPIITDVVETGGDNDADTITAKWTGVRFTNSTHAAGYTVGTFMDEALAYVDRVHEWNGSRATNPIPAYLMGGEYIMAGNDNRDNASFRLQVAISTRAFVYMLIDWRMQDGSNANPPTFGPNNMQWILDEGWQAMTNGLNRFGRTDWPDEVGVDEGGEGDGPGVGINQYSGIYMKVFEPGTFTLRQSDTGGRNMYGVVVVAAEPPPVPTNVVAIAGDGRATITWHESGGARAYVVSRANVAGGPYTPLATNATTIYVDSGLVNGTTYYYVVAAEGAGGTSSSSSEVSVTPANAPSNVVAVGGAGQVDIAWDALSGAVSYNIGRSSSPVGPFTNIATEVTGLTYGDTNVVGGQRFYYVVTAVLEGGALSGQSEAAAGITIPNIPTVTASLLGGSAIQVNWSGAGSEVTGYVVEESIDGGDTYAVIANLDASARGLYRTNDIFPDSQFFYRVAAVNESGGSEFSEPVQIITPTFGVGINFANPTFATNFPGYLNDYGGVYGDRGNGFIYGWEADNLGGARERNSTASPDKRWDTLNHWQRAGAPTNWQIEIPNGFYRVRIGSFDPTAVDSRYQHNVEGVITPVITPVSGQTYMFDLTTVVEDGALSVTSGPQASNNKINFIEIYSATPVLPEIGVEPQDDIVEQNRSASLTVELSAGSTPLQFQWYLNGGAVEGATNQTLNFPAAQLEQGGEYQVVISNFGGSVTSRVAVLTVSPDVEPPSVVSIASIDGVNIGVCFNEQIDTTAGNPVLDPFNYLVNDGGGAAVQEVFVQPDGRSLRLLLTETLAEGTFRLTIANVADLAGNSAANIVVDGNNLGMQAHDIGAVTHAGSHFACDEDHITVVGGGSDVWGAADQFHAIYRMVEGDFDAKVQVTGLAGADAITKAVLVARESTNTAARAYHVSVNPLTGRNRTEAAVRANTGGTTAAAGSSFTPANIPNFWMRITREGNTFTLMRSSNGVDWVAFSTNTAVYPSSIMVGIGVTAHNNTLLATGSFSGLSITQPSSDVGIAGSASTSVVALNGEVTTTLTITNAGPDAANLVNVSGTVDANVEVTSATSSQGTVTVTNGQLTANLGSLDANGTATITITGTATNLGQSTSVFTVTSASADNNAENASATVMFEISDDQPPQGPNIDAATAAKSGSTFSFSFSTEAGVTYQLQAAPTVVGPWETIDTIVGTGNPATAQDPAATEEAKFYRILVGAPPG